MKRWNLPIRRIEADPDASLPGWAADIPAVAQFLADGMVPGTLTVLVGENGTGKSTIVEGVAQAYGINGSGGSPNSIPEGRRTDTSPLGEALRIERGAGASRWGFFLRAETMHAWFEQTGGSSRERDYLHMSHGESFFHLLNSNRFESNGLFLFDEPESALSFTAQLALVGQLHELASTGHSQIIVATHSPVLAAVPGARLLELGDWGMRESEWSDLALVDHYRRFTRTPHAYLRHVIS